MLLLCYPRCTTCQKAKKWLEANGIPFDERNIAVDNPTAEELKTWRRLGGQPARKFFNTSGLKYKELRLKDRLPEMTESEMFDLLATDGMLVKRPILVAENGVLVGFKEDEWEAHLPWLKTLV